MYHQLNWTRNDLPWMMEDLVSQSPLLIAMLEQSKILVPVCFISSIGTGVWLAISAYSGYIFRHA
ncbi:hypothetical protein NEOLEDRAFT_26557 [Neolentinus lepideus HHB14362 ss-1]|uniref:Uncharacterized protein n=1 Tax=Neolentinus lepideus HHB14362 ss-1 TaxID=1314782 RepID=A0A165W4I2_9AGAM|nr:hypothetical protein NEOLEDRAFT_26557 [Neolentinus lepideus HHB14362 ss-1]